MNTLNNYIYPHPNKIGLSKQIQDALEEMRKKMFPDQGYDILPLYSAEFLKGDKLGFGLQQNVYMDLPLYGATEYIYMVDKRNGGANQVAETQKYFVYFKAFAMQSCIGRTAVPTESIF